MNKKSKCFSACNRGQRKKSDFYQTPFSMTEQLLEHEKFDYNKSVLEPACGKMAIVKVIRKYWDEKFYCMYDKFTHRSFFGDDFLTSKSKADYIITNPPYSLALEFIQKAKQTAKEKFAMLLPLSYLHGQKRYEQKIFTDVNCPLTKIYIFTRYPLLTDSIREDGKYNTGMIVYMWAIWENTKNEKGIKKAILNMDRPIIKWINNNQYILKRGE